MLHRLTLGLGLAPSALFALIPVADAQQAAGAAVLGAEAFGSEDAFHPRLSLQGTTVVGEELSLTVRNAGPSNLGLLLYSTASQPLYLPSVMATVYPGAPLFVEGFTVGNAADAEGLLAIDPIPASLSGTAIVAQAATFSIVAPGLFRVTDALELQFGSAPRSNASIGSLAYGLGLGNGLSPSGIADAAIADFDGDGVVDVVASPAADAQVPIPAFILGDGSGAFGLPGVAGFFQSERVRVADFNGDGLGDVLSFDLGGEVELIGNVGSIATTLIAELPSGAALREAQPVDYDNDGDLDVVAFSSWPPELYLHRNDGAINFTSLAPVSVPFSQNLLSDGIGFAVADFDGDGFNDYALANGLGELVVMQGTANGVGAPLSSSTLSNPGFETGLAAYDVNLDGDVDLAVAYGDDPVGPFAIDQMFGDGAGGFQANFPLPIPRPAHSIRAGDVEGDGDLDLLVTTNDGNAFADAYFIESQGPSIFPSFYEAARPIPLGGRAVAAEFVDSDGDGDLDLIAATADSGEATVVRWVAGAGFATPLATDAPGFADSLRLSDVDGDGNLDLVARDSGSGEVWLALGNGDRTFGSAELQFVDVPGGLWDLADLDGDGDEEFVIAAAATSSGSRLIVYSNEGGVFDDKLIFGGTFQGVPSALGFGNFDGDDVGLDIALTTIRETTTGDRLTAHAFTHSVIDLAVSAALVLISADELITLPEGIERAGLGVFDGDLDGVDELVVTSDDLENGDALIFTVDGFNLTGVAAVLGAHAVGEAPRTDLDLDGTAQELALIPRVGFNSVLFASSGLALDGAAITEVVLDADRTERAVMADIGGSTYADLVVVDSLGVLTMVTGSGGADSIALRDQATIQAGGMISDFDLGDLDGDGVAEVVAIHFGLERRLVVTTPGE